MFPEVSKSSTPLLEHHDNLFHWDVVEEQQVESTPEKLVTSASLYQDRTQLCRLSAARGAAACSLVAAAETVSVGGCGMATALPILMST